MKAPIELYIPDPFLATDDFKQHYAKDWEGLLHSLRTGEIWYPIRREQNGTVYCPEIYAR